mgnify:CR=1 FL=1
MIKEEMKIAPFYSENGQKPFWIAGPCSAESEEQMLQTAHALKDSGIDLFRAGSWKPRTRPNNFEGLGTEALDWLKLVKEETGMAVTTEVANASHVEETLKRGIDVIWIGARTTVNPFSVQEIADALKGVDIPVLIKNPINPDLKLWLGAIERIYHSGVKQIGVIHRGFSSYGSDKYRNQPRWQIAIELRRLFPELTMICDSSHISGTRDLLEEVAQKAFDLNYDGIMLEVHPDPNSALSDPEQQITPQVFKEMKARLQYRQAFTDNEEFLQSLENFRHQIDEIDDEIISLMASRMKLAGKIGEYKKRNNISILQTKRWSEILQKNVEKGDKLDLSSEFMTSLFKAVHQESINRQHKIMKSDK